MKRIQTQKRASVNTKMLVIIIVLLTIYQLLILFDEEDEYDETEVIEKIDLYVERTIPNFSDNQFKQHFRMLPETFEILLQQVNRANNMNEELRGRGQPELSLEKQLLLTVWYIANMDSMRSVADRFGVTKSSCWRMLYRSCNRIYNANQMFGIISWPNEDRALEIINAFENINGFPGVTGVIDGTFIRIDKPPEHPNSYINRKDFPAIIVQAVCDHRRLFLDVYVRQPGSLNDARVFRKSDLYERITNNEINFIHDSHIIGDLAYPLMVNLMVGFMDRPNRTQAQLHFSRLLSEIRVVIENAFSLLKNRFRRLKYLETQRLDLACLLILTACILHNICILNGDFIDVEDDEDNNDVEEIIEGPVDAAGNANRNNLVNYLNRNI